MSPYVHTDSRPDLRAPQPSQDAWLHGQGLRLTIAGLVVGVGAAIALTRLLGSLLFEVEPADPATFAAVAVFMVVVALAACFVPAHRATRVDPMLVLRVE